MLVRKKTDKKIWLEFFSQIWFFFSNHLKSSDLRVEFQPNYYQVLLSQTFLFWIKKSFLQTTINALIRILKLKLSNNKKFKSINQLFFLSIIVNNGYISESAMFMSASTFELSNVVVYALVDISPKFI